MNQLLHIWPGPVIQLIPGKTRGRSFVHSVLATSQKEIRLLQLLSHLDLSAYIRRRVPGFRPRNSTRSLRETLVEVDLDAAVTG